MKDATLVLVPGLMCDHAVWSPVCALLGGWRFEVADHGDCDSLPAMAQRVLAWAPERFALAGHSMGGRVALEVLRLAPERVTHLALLDTGHLPRAPGQPGEEEARKRQALLRIAQVQGVRAMASQWLQGMVHPHRLGDPLLVASILAMFERKSARVFERQIRALLNRPDASDVLRTVRVPTLVMCGRQDSWAPPAQHEALCAALPEGVGVLELVEGAGHMLPMERPEAVSSAFQAWLQRGA